MNERTCPDRNCAVLNAADAKECSECGRWLLVGHRPRPEKYPSVRYQVVRALKDGRLVRQPCEVCGAPKTHGHHEDYDKPLAVIWLCPLHHRQRHVRQVAA